MARLSKAKIYSLLKENKIYYINLTNKKLIPTICLQQWIDSGGNATRFDQIIAIVNSECGWIDGNNAYLPKTSVPKGGEDWETTTCPSCGTACWTRKLLREIIDYGDWTVLCTDCAAKKQA